MVWVGRFLRQQCYNEAINRKDVTEMTTGQRIAQKRKELGLSQEALGEQMGVSRQAIYKWEADQALPEIEKLVALSKYFGTTVGWLLGVEEAESRESTAEDQAILDEFDALFFNS